MGVCRRYAVRRWRGYGVRSVLTTRASHDDREVRLPHSTRHRARRASSLAVALVLTVAVISLARPSLAHESLDRNVARINAEISLNRGDATLYLRRSELHRLHRDWASALADLHRAIELAPDRVDLDYYLALIQIEAERPADALAAVDRYLLRGPDRAGARLVRSRALIELGRIHEAVRDLDRAIELQPSPQTYLSRADLLVAFGNLDHAVTGLDEGISRLGDVPALIERALAIDQGRGHRAAALARLDAVLARGSAPRYWRARRVAVGEPTESQRATSRATKEPP